MPLPVILLSARAGEGASIEGMQEGADDYIVKPFSARDLVARVAARLEIARARATALTGEKAIRAQAEAESEKLQRLFMQAPVAVAILEGSQHTFTFANPPYRALVGGMDVVGKALLEALPEFDGQGLDALMDGWCRPASRSSATKCSSTWTARAPVSQFQLCAARPDSAVMLRTWAPAGRPARR